MEPPESWNLAGQEYNIMQKESKMSKFQFKKPKRLSDWPFSNQVLHSYKSEYDKTMTIKRMRSILEDGSPYYTIEIRRHNGADVGRNTILAYKVKKLDDDQTKCDEQLFAWMCKIGNDYFKHLHFGPLHRFESAISSIINK